MFKLIEEYTDQITLVLFVVVIVYHFAFFVYHFRKRQTQPEHAYYWKGYLCISASFFLFISHIVIQLPQTFSHIRSVVAIILMILGFFLLASGNKLDTGLQDRKSQLTDISRPVGIVFGIITLACVPFIFLFSIFLFIATLMVDNSQSMQMQWFTIIISVVSVVLSIWLALAGWRLYHTKKGSKESLFTPYWLWFRISGILCLIIALSRLIHKNIQGVWVALIAIVLLLLSKHLVTEKQQID